MGPPRGLVGETLLQHPRLQVLVILIDMKNLTHISIKIDRYNRCLVWAPLEVSSAKRFSSIPAYRYWPFLSI
jgi:hypothetical protein